MSNSHVTENKSIISTSICTFMFRFVLFVHILPFLSHRKTSDILILKLYTRNIKLIISRMTLRLISLNF